MKITKYFCGIGSFNGNLLESINKLTSERDAFVQENQHTIGEIESEEIVMESGGASNVALVIVIKIIYYPKTEQ